MKEKNQQVKNIKVRNEVHRKLAVFCAENEISMIAQASLYIEAGLKSDLADYKPKKK